MTVYVDPRLRPRPVPLPPPPMLPRSVYMAFHQSPYKHLPASFFVEAYKHVGPIFQIRRQDGRFETVMAGAEANHFMQVEGSARYTYAQEVRQAQNEALGVRRSLISMHGDEHYRFRKLHKPGYARSALDHNYPVVIDAVRRFVRSWQPGQTLSLEHIMPQISAEVLCRAVMNHTSARGYYEDIQIYTRTITMAAVAGLSDMAELQSPAYKRAEQRALQHADDILATHRAGLNGRRPDVLDDILAANAAEPGLFTEQELRYSALGSYVGGMDSVAYTCAFMLYALLTHPPTLARVQAEIAAAFDGDGMTPAGLRAMIDLRHAAYETLRLYPVSAAVKSTVHTPFDFAGHHVAAGTSLITATGVAHFLPEHFAEPYRFDIDRYAEPRHEHRRPGVFAPYGAGVHVCLGAGMADVLIMLIVATMLREAQFDLDPSDYRLQIEMRPTPLPKHLNLRLRHHSGR